MPERLESTSTNASAARVEALVRAERVRALFDRNAVAQATVLLNSALVAVALWGDSPPARLLAWVGALWLVALGRLALGAAFRRASPPPGDAARWARRFTVGAAVNGVLWGAAPLLAGGGPLAHVVFVAFVLGGMSAGAALSNASWQPAFFAFVVPALLPMLGVLLSGGDRLRLGMGALLAVFAAAVSAISRSAGRALGEAVRLRFANAELAGKLGALNADLEARVAERSAQLEAASAREREQERQLASAARLAMVGSLAAGVAHEINNPLTYVKSNVSYVRDELSHLDADPDARAALDEALADAGEGVERVRAIVRNLMTLSHVEASRVARAVDLHAALDACLDLVRREVQAKERAAEDEGPTVPARR